MMKLIRSRIVAAALAGVAAPVSADEPVPPPVAQAIVKHPPPATPGYAIAVPTPAAEPQVYVQCLMCDVDAAAWKRLAAGPLFGRKGGECVVLDASQDELNNAIVELKKGDAIDVLSRPQLLLTNKQTGFFQVGQQVPFGDHAITLRTTPTVTDSGRVKLALEYSRLAGKTDINFRDTIECRDGQTVAVARANPTKAGRTDVLFVTPHFVGTGAAVGVALADGRAVATPPTPAPLMPRAMHTLVAPPRVTAAPPAAGREHSTVYLTWREPVFGPIGVRAGDVRTEALPGKAFFDARDLAQHAWQARLREPTVFVHDGQALTTGRTGRHGFPFAIDLTAVPAHFEARPIVLRNEFLHDAAARTPAVAGASATGRVTKVFHVMELVTPIPGAGESPATRPSDRLVSLVKAMCRPNTWDVNGGSGSADYYDIGGALVVNNSPEVMREVADLLDSLRQLQDTQVSSEVRVVCVPAGFCDRHNLFGPAAGDKVAFLDAARAQILVEAAQTHPSCGVMQAPKISQFNGQKSSLTVGQEETFTVGVEFKMVDGRFVFEPRTETVRMPAGEMGIDLSLQPTISADRKTVRLAAAAAVVLSNGPTANLPLELPGDDKGMRVTVPNVTKLAVEKTVSVPDGKTCVLFAGVRPGQECRTECGPPVVSQIPYVNRLFKNVGIGKTEPHEVLVLITPRIINAREEEERQTGVKLAGGTVADPEVAGLVAKYKQAVAAGKADEALRHAMAALAKDPTCFAGDK